jgi:XTP/dITP diphosphohydrolase
MHRRFTGDTLVLASHNPGKLQELQELLADHGVKVRSAGELGLIEPEETEPDFQGNAALKAHAAARATGLPALADDSGLEVMGLEGRPGVHSARWAGPRKDFAAAMTRVTTELAERFGDWQRADKRAAFVSVLCLAWPDGHAEVFEGRVSGELLPEPRGAGGFGYDPIFVPEGEKRTFAELSRTEKSALSHRGIAMRALLDAVFR